jgi:hypothetical protein
MSSTQPAGADRQLPRGHLLVLNRSFRRTLEAENKSPRTIEAYTDASGLSGCWARAADPGRCQSAARPPRHWIATYGPGRGTDWLTCLIFGLAGTGP